MEGFLGDRKAEMEGFLGGRGDRNRGEFDPRHRGDWKNPTPQYIEGIVNEFFASFSFFLNFSLFFFQNMIS